MLHKMQLIICRNLSFLLFFSIIIYFGVFSIDIFIAHIYVYAALYTSSNEFVINTSSRIIFSLSANIWAYARVKYPFYCEAFIVS